MRVRRRLALAGLTAVLLLPASPALAFHHILLPAASCAESDHAGGTTMSVAEHNPVFFNDGVPILRPPLPPSGTPAVERGLTRARSC